MKRCTFRPIRTVEEERPRLCACRTENPRRRLRSTAGGAALDGQITKQGSSLLRWALVQAAHRAAITARFAYYHEQQAKRRGKAKAAVALALKAIADGESNPTALAGLANPSLRATPEQLSDALSACQELHPVYRQLVKMALEELQLLEDQMEQLDQKMASLLSGHQDQVQRLAEVPGLGVDSAQQIIAEVGVEAATFPSPEDLSSWVGICPGQEETAGVNHSHRSPKGNRQMRRLLNQAAHAAIRNPGTIFAILYHRYVPRMGHNQTIAVIGHRLCRLIWRILHQGSRYEERGPAADEKTKRRRTTRMIRELRRLGYRIELANSISLVPA